MQLEIQLTEKQKLLHLIQTTSSNIKQQMQSLGEQLNSLQSMYAKEYSLYENLVAEYEDVKN